VTWWRDDPVVSDSPPWAADPILHDQGSSPTKQPATASERGKALQAGVNKGIAGLIGLPVDTIENIVNIALSVRGLASDDPNIQLMDGSWGSSKHVEEVMRRLNIGTDNPRPDDLASRLLHTGGKVAAGPPTRGALAAGSGGAVAREVGGPQWEGVGAVTPAAAGAAMRSAKGAIAERTRENVEDFQGAGTMPSVGQATGSTFIQGLENLLAKFPGGAGRMRRFSEEQQRQMGDKARTGVTAEDAGRQVKTGIERFVEDFKRKSDQLYNELDKHVPQDARVDVRETRAVLADLNANIPGAPSLSQWFKNAKIQGLERSLKDDTEGTAGTQSAMSAVDRQLLEQLPGAQRNAELAAASDGMLPYEAVKKLRTLVGQELANTSLVSEVPKDKWRALYAALSRDMEALAASRGEEASKAFSRANQHHAAGIQRIEDVLDGVAKKVDPEDAFKAFMPTNPDQSNKLRAVMRSLSESERKVVTEAVVNRMGRATPGRQDEVGEVFSSETFLTNWNRLSPEAKVQLFPDREMRKSVDALAAASSRIREGAKVFSNPAGTAGAAAGYGVYGSLFGGVVVGEPMATVSALGALTTANIGARMLTSPKVVEWLAKAPKVSHDGAAAHLARLAVIYNSADHGLRTELDRFMESAQGIEVAKDDPKRRRRRDELLDMLNGP